MLFTLENRKYFECSKEEKQTLIPFIGEIAELAKTVKTSGLLALEPMLPDIEDTFLRYGLTLIVDATYPDEVQRLLETKAIASGKIGVELLRMVIIIECVLGLANGRAPRLIEENAMLYLGE